MRGEATATVTPSPASWDVAVTADVTGRGLGRLALRLFRGKIQTSFDAAAEAYWNDVPQSVAGLRDLLGRLQVEATYGLE